MKRLSSILLLATLLIFSCSNLQSQSTSYNLAATDFNEKIKQLPDAPIVDVRTPEEFENGHLQNALNIDWNNDDFNSKITLIDKSKPVFVYCLAGSRSAAAAEKMRKDGFKEVYELKGGILKWRSASLPEVSLKKSNGMSVDDFKKLLVDDKLVLIDFYAEWCMPCKKMKPYIEEIAKEKSNEVKVIRIDADANQLLSKELKIDALPVLQLYKNQKVVWSNQGFIEKAAVVNQLNSQH